MKKRILSVCLTLTCCFSMCGNAIASDLKEPANTVFSTVPTEHDLRFMDRCLEKDSTKAWFIDNNGNRTDVAPVDMSNRNGRSFTEGRVLYTFVRYDQSVTKSNDLQHFVSSCSLRNRGTTTIPMKYTQNETVVSTWTVSARVEAEPELGIALLNALQAKFGVSVDKSHTTQSSTICELQLDVPPGTTGRISKYYAGKYSGGQAVWHAEDVIGGYDNGYYYEETGAWGIAKNEVNWDWEVTEI